MSGAVEVPIPDSTAAVKMHRLHTWDDGTSVMIVNFPAGWSRPIEGSYECAEEFFVFEGELHMSVMYLLQAITLGFHLNHFALAPSPQMAQLPLLGSTVPLNGIAAKTVKDL